MEIERKDKSDCLVDFATISIGETFYDEGRLLIKVADDKAFNLCENWLHDRFSGPGFRKVRPVRAKVVVE